MKYNLFYPSIFKEQWLESLGSLFDTKMITEGEKVIEFEEKFGEKFGYNYCVTVNSGTSALELAYKLIGINEGDEILSVVLTCSATNIPLLRCGANIKWVDINYDMTMDYKDFISKVTDKTKAVVVVSLGGVPVDERIYSYCKEKGIPVVVDACQALGVPEPNGDYVVYSFQAIKHFTTGDGGMLVVRDRYEYNRAKKLRWFGIDRQKQSLSEQDYLSNRKMCMDMDEAGHKWHMNNLAATMGLVGLQQSDDMLEYRMKLAVTYMENLNKEIHFIADGSYWLFCIHVPNKKDFIENMRAEGVEVDPVHLRNDKYTLFKTYTDHKLSNMDEIEKRYVYLPLNTRLTTDDIKEICKIVNEQY